MKKIVALILVSVLILSLVVTANSAKVCSHEWRYYELKREDTTTGSYFFTVPSCPGHPWPHKHHALEKSREHTYICPKCGATKSVYTNTRHTEFCDLG